MIIVFLLNMLPQLLPARMYLFPLRIHSFLTTHYIWSGGATNSTSWRPGQRCEHKIYHRIFILPGAMMILTVRHEMQMRRFNRDWLHLWRLTDDKLLSLIPPCPSCITSKKAYKKDQSFSFVAGGRFKWDKLRPKHENPRPCLTA